MKGMTPLQQEEWQKKNEKTPSVVSTVPMDKSDTESDQGSVGLEAQMSAMSSRTSDEEQEEEDNDELDDMGFAPPPQDTKRSREPVETKQPDEEKQNISNWSEASTLKGSQDVIKFNSIVGLLRHIQEVIRHKSNNSQASIQDAQRFQALINAVKNFPAELRQLQFVLREDLPPPKKTTSTNKDTEEPSAKRQKVLTFAFATDPSMQRDFATGVSALSEKKNQVSDFIRKCRLDLLPYEAWSDAASICSMDFEMEKETVANANIGDATLLTVCLDLSVRLKRTEAETKKLVYLLGFGVHRFKKHDNKTWFLILQEEHFGHLCESTLRRYWEFYKFVDLYPMFLRANVSYSAILRYKDAVDIVFESNPEARSFWSQCVNAKVPEFPSGYFY